MRLKGERERRDVSLNVHPRFFFFFFFFFFFPAVHAVLCVLCVLSVFLCVKSGVPPFTQLSEPEAEPTHPPDT